MWQSPATELIMHHVAIIKTVTKFSNIEKKMTVPETQWDAGSEEKAFIFEQPSLKHNKHISYRRKVVTN